MHEHQEQRTVEITFNPAQLEGEPISIRPDRVELDQGLETRIEFVLKMKDPRAGENAKFPQSGFIEVTHDDLGVVRTELEDCCTRGNLRVPRRDGGDSRSYPYHVRAEYEGRVYRSAGYPVLLDPPLIDP